MKALSSIVIVLLTAIGSFSAPASFEVKESFKANVFNIQYQSAQKGRVEVSILNSRNEVIFNEVITNLSTFVRPYNFSNLPEGEYTIAIEDASGEYSQKINHSFENLTSYSHVSSVPNQANKYWLNIFNNGSETVDVRIVSANGQVLFEQSVFVSGNYSMVYDLNKVKKNSTVTFEVTDGNGKTHTTTF